MDAVVTNEKAGLKRASCAGDFIQPVLRELSKGSNRIYPGGRMMIPQQPITLGTNKKKMRMPQKFQLNDLL